MSDVIYRRRGASRTAWAIPLVLVVVVMIYAVVSGLADDNLGRSVLAFGIGVAPILVIWLLTLWSINRYGDVTVTRETLRVGRSTVPVAELRRDWVAMLAERADPTLGARLADWGQLAVTQDRQLDGGRGRLLGGGFGANLGQELVTLELTDGSRVSAPTKDRRGLLAALLTALGG